MANSKEGEVVLLLRWLNRSEVLFQLLLICLLECATIHNAMDVTKRGLHLVLINRLPLASSLLRIFECGDVRLELIVLVVTQRGSRRSLL
jgi:hypothetical protein